MSEYKIGDRDIIQLDIDGDYYFKHILAMTDESLHSKSDIAAELGWRDREIQKLKNEIIEWKKVIKIYDSKSSNL